MRDVILPEEVLGQESSENWVWLLTPNPPSVNCSVVLLKISAVPAATSACKFDDPPLHEAPESQVGSSCHASNVGRFHFFHFFPPFNVPFWCSHCCWNSFPAHDFYCAAVGSSRTFIQFEPPCVLSGSSGSVIFFLLPPVFFSSIKLRTFRNNLEQVGFLRPPSAAMARSLVNAARQSNLVEKEKTSEL